jgi:predicted TIM-barrel fold metal-dependent hydrolase
MIAFHIGPDAYEKTHPVRAARIAERFPETNILLVHMGMADRAMNESVLRAAEEFSNLYVIGSATTAMHVHRAITRLGADRVLFGTDGPFKFVPVVLAMYNALLDSEFAPDEKALVMGGNMQRLFGVRSG